MNKFKHCHIFNNISYILHKINLYLDTIFQAFFSSPRMANITSQFSIYHINAPGQVSVSPNKYLICIFTKCFDFMCNYLSFM